MKDDYPPFKMSVSHWQISKKGLAKIKEFAGFEPVRRQGCPDGWLIGYDHCTGNKKYETISEEEACILLAYDIDDIRSWMKRHIDVDISGGQFDAMCSWMLQLGIQNFWISGITMRLNSDQPWNAALIMRDFKHGIRRPDERYLARRQWEFELMTNL